MTSAFNDVEALRTTWVRDRCAILDQVVDNLLRLTEVAVSSNDSASSDFVAAYDDHLEVTRAWLLFEGIEVRRSDKFIGHWFVTDHRSGKTSPPIPLCGMALLYAATLRPDILDRSP